MNVTTYYCFDSVVREDLDTGTILISTKSDVTFLFSITLGRYTISFDADLLWCRLRLFVYKIANRPLNYELLNV